MDRPTNIRELLSKISTPKVPLWRFNQQSTLEAVFAPMVSKTEVSEHATCTTPETAPGNKMTNKYITYEESPIEVVDTSVYWKIKVACTCTPPNRTGEMLVLLDSVASTPFFRSFHVSWREQILRRIELMKIKKGVTLFTQNQAATCAYFLLSGRLANEILIGNAVTELLVETTAPNGMFKTPTQKAKEEQEQLRLAKQNRIKKNSNYSNSQTTASKKEYMLLKPFMPGTEIDVDCLQPSRKGCPLRTKRNRTLTAMDDVFLFKLTLESFQEAVQVQDFNEDFAIWNFFTSKTAGGLGKKVFSTFTTPMEQQWKEMWHLKTFSGGQLISKQGERALQVYVLATGSLQVLRLNDAQQLLVVDTPRCGEFVLTGASEIIQSVLHTIPIYKTVSETSLISKAAADCYMADADAFYNFCYTYKWFANFMHSYYKALGLNDVCAKGTCGILCVW